MKTMRQLPALLVSACLLQAAPAMASLQARDLDGDAATIEAYYDTQLNITWMADFRLMGATSDWSTAMNWASAQTFGGVSGWRLPSTDDAAWNGTCNYGAGGTSICGYLPGANSSEVANLYYATLGNVGYPSAGYGLTNTGPFKNLFGSVYWSSTGTSTDPSQAWVFGFFGGDQGPNPKTYSLWAEPVHDGDVGVAVAVPEPAGVVLMLAGLVGLGLHRRHMQRRELR